MADKQGIMTCVPHALRPVLRALPVLAGLAVAVAVLLPFWRPTPTPAPLPTAPPSVTVDDSLLDALTPDQEKALTQELRSLRGHHTWRVVVFIDDGTGGAASHASGPSDWWLNLTDLHPELFPEQTGTRRIYFPSELSEDVIVIHLDPTTLDESRIMTGYGQAQGKAAQDSVRTVMVEANTRLRSRLTDPTLVRALPPVLDELLAGLARPVVLDRSALVPATAALVGTALGMLTATLLRSALRRLALARATAAAGLPRSRPQREASLAATRERSTAVVLALEELRPRLELDALARGEAGRYAPTALARLRVLERRSCALARLLFDAGGLDGDAPPTVGLQAADLAEPPEAPTRRAGSVLVSETLDAEPSSSPDPRLVRARLLARADLLSQELQAAHQSLERTAVLLSPGTDPAERAEVMDADARPLLDGLERVRALVPDADRPHAADPAVRILARTLELLERDLAAGSRPHPAGSGPAGIGPTQARRRLSLLDRGAATYLGAVETLRTVTDLGHLELEALRRAGRYRCVEGRS